MKLFSCHTDLCCRCSSAKLKKTRPSGAVAMSNSFLQALFYSCFVCKNTSHIFVESGTVTLTFLACTVVSIFCYFTNLF